MTDVTDLLLAASSDHSDPGSIERAARALGWRRLITYSLPEEGGASLRGAGWTCLGTAGGGSWHRDSRPRVDRHPTQKKLRWEMAAPTQRDPGLPPPPEETP